MYTTVISVADLKAHLDHPEWVVVDCRFDLADPERGRREYLQSHIAGAQFADVDKDLSDHGKTGGGRHPLPDPARLVELFSRLGIDSDCQVVAYDATGGGFAARLWWLLRYMGHRGAALLDGGWPAWLAAGGPARPGEERRPPRTFQGQADASLLRPVETVTAAPLLIDSRDPARYRGELEPLDPRAGHIPGALNRFWKDNLDAPGYFKRAPELASEFKALYGGRPASEAVFYCGSGVTACHNILAAVHAGLPMPQLYAGSWSEWCADPSRPIATGGDTGTGH